MNSGWMKVGYRFKPATLGYLESSRPRETLMDCSMAGWLMDSEGWILWIRWSLLCWDDFAGNFPTLQRVIEFWSNLHVGWKIPPAIVGSILISEPTNWLSSSILQRSASNEWNFSTTYLKLSIFARPPRTTGRTWRIFVEASGIRMLDSNTQLVVWRPRHSLRALPRLRHSVRRGRAVSISAAKHMSSVADLLRCHMRRVCSCEVGVRGGHRLFRWKVGLHTSTRL